MCSTWKGTMFCRLLISSELKRKPYSTFHRSYESHPMLRQSRWTYPTQIGAILLSSGSVMVWCSVDNLVKNIISIHIYYIHTGAAIWLHCYSTNHHLLRNRILLIQPNIILPYSCVYDICWKNNHIAIYSFAPCCLLHWRDCYFVGSHTRDRLQWYWRSAKLEMASEESKENQPREAFLKMWYWAETFCKISLF